MKASNCRFLDRAVHPLDLPVGPGVERPCQTVFNAMLMACHIEPMRLVGLCPGALGELCAVIRQYGMDPVR